jgi:hypothetical protein
VSGPSQEEPVPDYPGRVLDARLHLLDRQVLDRDGVPVSTVDDLELEDVPRPEALDHGTAAPRLVALLHGAVLATRLFGGRPPASRLQRVPIGHVAEVAIVLRLWTSADEEVVPWVERWLRDHVFRHIPGGRRDPH